MSNTDICVNCFTPKKGYDVCPSCGWYDGAEPANAYHLYPGSVLRERYLVGMSVGFGGFGITYKAWDSKLGTVVAIKEFYPSGLVNRVPHEKNVVVYSGERETQFLEQKKRFLDEARTMSKFTNHPNIVNVFDFFEENNTAYIVMEYLDGISAKKYLEQCGGKVDERSAVDIIIPILDALTAIHAKKIVHRDISPDNIFLTLDNKIKLLDLGAARLTNSEKEETISVVIKPGYAPPEQYRSKSKQGPWTDIYGVGATLYKFLTGTTPEESIDRSVKDTMKKPSALGVPVGNSLDRIVMKAMAIKPELRFQSAQQMKNALLQQKEVDFPEDELKKRKVQRKILIAAVSVLSVVLVTSVTLFLTVLRPKGTLATVDIQPGSITMLLPAENQEAFDSIISQFNQEYADKNFQITPTYATAEEIANKSAAELPTLTVTDGFSADFMAENFMPLDMLVRSVEENDYVFAKQYETLYPSKLEMPLGFDVLVAYGNTSAANSTGVALPDTLQPSDKAPFGNKLIIGNDNYAQFLRVFDENALTQGEAGITVSEKSGEILSDIHRSYAEAQYKNGEYVLPAEQPAAESAEAAPTEEAATPALPATPVKNLADGKCLILVDDTAAYSLIQSTLAGYYTIIPITDGDNYIGQYSMHFGINKNAAENEKNIAQLFLAYCLSDVAQNVLHVQHHTSLPVHKVTLKTHAQINTELQFISESQTELQFLSKTQTALLGENRRLYAESDDQIEALCYGEAAPENPIVLK